jgi:hypothetical protein
MKISDCESRKENTSRCLDSTHSGRRKNRTINEKAASQERIIIGHCQPLTPMFIAG